MYDWIELIVEESLSISITKKKAFHRFKKDRTNFSQEKVKETLYKLVELAASRIGYQMKKARRGTILHDGRSKNGVHYGVTTLIPNWTSVKERWWNSQTSVP